MKKTILILLIATIGMTVFAQNSLDAEFEKFVSKQTTEKGITKFESLCGVDTIYFENPKTGELTAKANISQYKLKRDVDYKPKKNGDTMSGRFDNEIRDEYGEVIDSRKMTIEFKKDGESFTISNITDDKNSIWRLIGSFGVSSIFSSFDSII